MLVQFSITNFLSFREKTTFSMVKSKTAEGLPSHLFRATDSISLLRGAAFYGANASGKSNFVKALAFAKKFILDGLRPKESVPVESFRLDAERFQSPSEFEFILFIEETFYTYGFRVDCERVHNEWLWTDAGSGDKLCFERTTDSAGKAHVEFGDSLSLERKASLQPTADRTRPNQLMLTKTLDDNQSDFEEVLEWFRNTLEIMTPATNDTFLEVLVLKKDSYTHYLAGTLNAVGTGITRIDIEKIPLEETELNLREIREHIKNHIPTKAGDMTLTLLPDGRKILVDEDGRAYVLRMRTYRKNSTGEEVQFNPESESDGTKQFMNLHSILPILHEGYRVFVIDEIERSLHSQLTRYFIELALGDATPPPHSQLLFTTHDTNLIDTDLLRTDEIWFVEKDKGGASHLSALVEFKYPEGIDIEQGYLIGRFGALPFLGNLRKLKNMAAQGEN